MRALNNINAPAGTSRKAMLCIWLVVCFAPYCWVLFLSENRWLWVRLWPILPGITIASLLRSWLSQFGVELVRWLALVLATVLSVALPGTVLVLLWRMPRWRYVVVAVALAISCLLSWGAYLRLPGLRRHRGK